MNRQEIGLRNYHDGIAAEEIIARYYTSSGALIVARRWRGSVGEIDLVVKSGDELIFVEVKKARDFRQAAERLSARQLRRIIQSVDAYIAGGPHSSSTSVRVDVGLVNACGDFEIIQNVTL